MRVISKEVTLLKCSYFVNLFTYGSNKMLILRILPLSSYAYFNIPAVLHMLWSYAGYIQWLRKYNLICVTEISGAVVGSKKVNFYLMKNMKYTIFEKFTYINFCNDASLLHDFA